MITLKTLKWDNCFSYGPENELDLDDTKLTQIIGTNGVGKSSIPLIIEEVLYNKNSKAVKKADIANRNLGGGYHINLIFEKNEDIYEIDLTRKASIKVKLLKNGEDISSHTATNTYKTIEEIIGVDFKTFSQLVYQNTNASLQFLTATDANRKKFLIELLDLEGYVVLFEKFKDVAKEISDKNLTLKGKQDSIVTWLDNNKLSTTTLQPLLNLPEISEKDEQEVRHLLTEIKNVDEKNKKIIKNNENLKLLRNIDLPALQSIEATEILSDKEHKDEYAKTKAELDISNNLIKKIKKLEDKCPTCEQDISGAFKQSFINIEENKVKTAEEKLNDLYEKMKEIEQNNAQYKIKQDGIQNWENIYRSIDKELPQEPVDKEELETQYKEIEEKLREQKRELNRIIKENEQLTKNNTKIQIILEQTDEFENSLKSLKEEAEQVAALSSDLEILKKAFSTNGLIAYKIENLVGELQELVNKYLGELSDGRFTLGFVVSNDKLNVQITDEDKIVDILSLSSGELARVNTATLIAIRKLMSSISKSKINLLFLDEVINVLDDAGKEKIIEVLLQEDLNTYLVSHGWTHPLLEKIEIKKTNNISVLEK